MRISLIFILFTLICLSSCGSKEEITNNELNDSGQIEDRISTYEHFSELEQAEEK